MKYRVVTDSGAHIINAENPTQAKRKLRGMRKGDYRILEVREMFYRPLRRPCS